MTNILQSSINFQTLSQCYRDTTSQMDPLSWYPAEEEGLH